MEVKHALSKSENVQFENVYFSMKKKAFRMFSEGKNTEGFYQILKVRMAKNAQNTENGS